MIIILFFFLFSIAAYMAARLEYKPIEVRDRNIFSSFIKGGNMSIISIFLLSAAATAINVYYTEATVNSMAADRANYMRDFNNDLTAATSGLTYIFNLAYNYGGDFNTVLYITTFVSILVFLLGYKISNVSTPFGLLLFFSTTCLLNSFIALKQTYASAFVSLALIIMMKERSLRADILSIAFIFLALQFHAVSFMMLPLYILLRFVIKEETEYKPSKMIFVTLILMVLIGPLMVLVANAVSPISPYLSAKLLTYFGEEESQIAENGLIVLLKGAYIYYICYYLFKNKDYIKPNMTCYNQVLVLALVISACYLISPINYWLPRTAAMLEFPVLLFWSKSLDFVPNRRMLGNVSLILIAFFTYRKLWQIFIEQLHMF